MVALVEARGGSDLSLMSTAARLLFVKRPPTLLTEIFPIDQTPKFRLKRACEAPVLVGIVDPLTNQTAPGDEDAFEVDRGQLVPDGKRDDQITMNFLPQSIRVGFSVHTPREAPSVSAARRLTPIGSGKYLLLSHQSPRVGLKISAETRIH